MRITLLSHFPGKGGSTTLLVQLAEFFRGRNHEIGVVVGDDCADPVLREYAVVPRTPEGGWKQRMGAYVEVIRATRPDAVYSISGKDEFDVFRFLSCVRIRHVFSMEQHEFTDIPYWIRQAGPFLDAFTANTPDVLARIRSLTAEKAHNPFVGWTVPYRVNEAFNTVRITRSAPGSGDAKVTNVCFIGRLDQYQKRAHWLPEIMERCQSAGRNLRWHIYGQGPLEPFIRAGVEQRKLADKVCFHGWLESTRLAAQLPLHDIFFLCSRWEGLPAAMVEAMLCGLACVVPAIPAGITYALEKGGGWLYDAASPECCVAALLKATEDFERVQCKKAEAQRIARAMFSGSIVDEQLDRLEFGITRLSFNGQVLTLRKARKLRSVRAYVALRRRILNRLRVAHD